MNLLEELNKVKQKDIDKVGGDEFVKEVNQLLLGAHNEDEETLRKLGLTNYNGFERKLKSDIKRTKMAEEIYSSPSFTGKQIKDLCNTYYLKCLPVSYYRGKIPSGVPGKIKKFCDDREIKINSFDFFILAPIELFKTQVYEAPDPDPIIFYRQNEMYATSYGREKASEGDVFIQIENWGNDFTFMRKLHVLFDTYRNNRDENTPLKRTVMFSVLSLISIGIASFGYFNISLIPIALAIFLFRNNISLTYSIDERWNDDKV